MKIYYDEDANLEIIKSLKVAIIGYGSQGHAHANNLHDSGVDISVGLREGSASWEKAESAGLKVSSVEDSVKDSDFVMILAPDEFQSDLYTKKIEPNMVFTIEPGIYIPDEGFGVRLEDVYLVNQNSLPTNLMKSIPIEIEEIEEIMNS